MTEYHDDQEALSQLAQRNQNPMRPHGHQDWAGFTRINEQTYAPLPLPKRKTNTRPDPRTSGRRA